MMGFIELYKSTFQWGDRLGRARNFVLLVDSSPPWLWYLNTNEILVNNCSLSNWSLTWQETAVIGSRPFPRQPLARLGFQIVNIVNLIQVFDELAGDHEDNALGHVDGTIAHPLQIVTNP